MSAERPPVDGDEDDDAPTTVELTKGGRGAQQAAGVLRRAWAPLRRAWLMVRWSRAGRRLVVGLRRWRGPSRRRAGIAFSVGLALAGVAAAMAVLAPPGLLGREPKTAQHAGRRMGRGLVAGLAGIEQVRQAVRCLRADGDEGQPRELRVGGRTLRIAAGRLEGGRARRRKLRLGVVGDARGDEAETLENARAAVASFRRARVDVVLALGGLGTTPAQIEQVLRLLAGERKEWLVLAQPGDREPVWAFREAIATLVAQGVPVVDGAATGIAVVDGVAVGFLPGVAVGANGRGHGLVSGVDGCGRTAEDVQARAALLAREPGPRLLASHAPPRGQGDFGTDVAVGGMHIGDEAVTRAAEAARASLVVHGLIDETGGLATATGEGTTVLPLRVGTWGKGVAVAAGALDASAALRGDGTLGRGGAVIVEVAGDRARLVGVVPAATRPLR